MPGKTTLLCRGGPLVSGGSRHRTGKPEADYSGIVNVMVKVLGLVKNGGPGWTRTNDLGLIRTAL